ncbi:dolichol phosphate-mannose biosynthesis regulatory [Phanerochaete sordida]|uniref:Dolichol phosphate-mannose biosynthesis regulatory protein n=1 Tax=Phanerochaete sordida TaxID=48140 RepID=A0A9P3GBH9_9APHY|nr:dolichol phosphate-mannose biosynthesis regulatory [Phanerochaete sordida]
MGMSDKSLGALMLSAAAAAFGYYTIWTILLPFFDASSPVHQWFPSREWAVRIPAFILVVGLSAIGMLLGFKVIQDHSRTRENGAHMGLKRPLK